MVCPVGREGGGEEVSSAVARKARFDRPILLSMEKSRISLEVELMREATTVVNVASTSVRDLVLAG